MYCFTYASSYDCIFNELLLWSDISSEHPIFIKTVASLSGKNLSEEIIDMLMEVNEKFSRFNMKVKLLRVQRVASAYYLNNTIEMKKLIKEFLFMDEQFLSLLDKIKTIGTEDKVWQTLLEHITEEQNFKKALFMDLGIQI